MKEFRCHEMKPKEHVLVYTTLFPNSRQPTHGVFVNERIRHLGKYYNIKVVAPVHVTTKVKSYFSGGKIPPSEKMGLVPILWATGTGADVMKRISAPMIGGILTSFLLELLVYPVIYQVWKERIDLKKKPDADSGMYTT